MEKIKLNRDDIATLDLINPIATHSSRSFHIEIENIIKSSTDYDDYQRRL